MIAKSNEETKGKTNDRNTDGTFHKGNDGTFKNPFYFKKLAIKSFYSLKYRRICKI